MKQRLPLLQSLWLIASGGESNDLEPEPTEAPASAEEIAAVDNSFWGLDTEPTDAPSKKDELLKQARAIEKEVDDSVKIKQVQRKLNNIRKTVNKKKNKGMPGL